MNADTQTQETGLPLAVLGEPKRCRTCGRAIYWCKHVESGKAAPIDAQPNPKGNCIIYADGTYSVLHKSDVSPAPGRLHTNHFQTCPQAAQHKKK